MDTVVDRLLSGTMCSDCGANLGFQCTHGHADFASFALTCGCELNIQTYKELITQALGGTHSFFLV